MRYLKGICALVLALGMCLPAQATVQNIRVGGDIQIRGIARDTWDLNDVAGALGDDENWLDSAIRLQIEAEFMDEVAARIRLINERNWAGMDAAAGGIELDLAYLTLDQMFGFPVKATLGRQEIRFGEGFLIGDGFIEVDPIAYGKSVRRAFDALRLTHHVFPYTVDLFTAKIDDDPLGVGDDVDLHGLNIHFNHLDIATFDLGYFMGRYVGDAEVRALSLRGEGEILIHGAPGLTVKGEHVWQSGEDIGGRDIEDARGWYVGAEYALPDVLHQPYFGVTFIFMSGDDLDTPQENEAFAPLFEDKAWGTFAELNTVTGLGELQTNAKIWRLAAGLRPTDALSLGLSYYILEAEEVAAGMSDEVGDELNLALTFDYTEDVQFGLSAAWFDPGDALRPLDDTASQIVGSVKVSF